MIKLGIKERKCERCQQDTWMGYPIPLELHHINGNYKDNSLDNLQILCSNCHSLEPNFCVKKTYKIPSIEELKEWVDSGKTLYEICHLVGVRHTGPGHYKVKNLLEKYGLSVQKATSSCIRFIAMRW